MFSLICFQQRLKIEEELSEAKYFLIMCISFSLQILFCYLIFITCHRLDVNAPEAITSSDH